MMCDLTTLCAKSCCPKQTWFGYPDSVLESSIRSKYAWPSSRRCTSTRYASLHSSNSVASRRDDQEAARDGMKPQEIKLRLISIICPRIQGTSYKPDWHTDWFNTMSSDNTRVDDTIACRSADEAGARGGVKIHDWKSFSHNLWPLSVASIVIAATTNCCLYTVMILAPRTRNVWCCRCSCHIKCQSSHARLFRSESGKRQSGRFFVCSFLDTVNGRYEVACHEMFLCEEGATKFVHLLVLVCIDTHGWCSHFLCLTFSTSTLHPSSQTCRHRHILPVIKPT